MPKTMRPLYPYAEPKNPHMMYMDTLLGRVLYISYRNLLFIDLAGSKFANQWIKFTQIVNSNNLFYEYRARNSLDDSRIMFQSPMPKIFFDDFAP